MANVSRSYRFFAGFLRLLWPIKIIGIHHVSDRDTFDLIIKYPPITDNSKIQWRENKKLFFEEKIIHQWEKETTELLFW